MRDPEGNLLPDTVLQERYKVINLIQTGPTSRMYRCFDIKRNRHVFVKELIATYTDPSLRQQAIEQFKKEAKILFKLKQENLPKFEDYFDYEENRYLILEYVEGKRLNVIVESQTSFLSERQVIDWSIELCEALAYLHNREPNPVIFRDLSPQSILLADEGKLKLIDFGISKIYEADAKTMGIAKTMTQHYSPIEQHAGTTDKRSDIYSLGATMYFLITREPPMDCIERIVEDEPMEPCSKFNPGISRELERIIMKAMEIDKKDRYQDIEEMKAELVKLASSTPAITDKVQTQKTAMDIHTPKPFSQIREGYDKSFERKEVIDTRTVDKSILSLKSPIKRDSLLSPSKPAFQSSEDKSPLMSRPVAGSTFPYQQKPVTTPPKPEEKHRLFGSQKVVDGKPLEGTVKSFSRPVGTDFHGGSSLIPSRRRFLEDRERPIPSRMPSKEGLPEPLQDQHPLPPRPPFKGDIGQPVEKYPQRDIRPQEGSDIY
ncbi:MAG TPA: serine/threonine-protein kinase, partial [Candidatus Eremiobacteraeota bacterium]|nr:serine/threonine-protein kinase [Candidatus Eremiobacteraeota bacterium]